MDDFLELLQKGFILYQKSGRIGVESPQLLGVLLCIFNMVDFPTWCELKQRNRVYRNNRGH